MTEDAFVVRDEIIEKMALRAVRLARAARCGTFWAGCAFPGGPSQKDTVERAAERRRVNRAFGERVERMCPDLVGAADHPDVFFRLFVQTGRVTARVAPLYVYGRYLKLSRQIPQSRWPCTRHRKHDCPRCGGTGKIYPWSVEEAIADGVARQVRFKGTKLHCLGREDVDARMVGRGRPFVLELVRPLDRCLDAGEAQRWINERWGREVQVREMQLVGWRLLNVMNKAKPDKQYLALCECERPVDAESLARLSAMKDVVLDQKTPQRVAHRRADLVRRRVIRRMEAWAADSPQRFMLKLTAESGAYVKEFVSSDAGGTRPSVSEFLGAACRVVELDVLDVLWDLPAPPGAASA
ncbi:MAG TPA: tRNA pseudouridine(54/55) synthase Pus10 [Candidatus Brocadiia bacterium]|nr:tRNA pseudouridine(54/55) synthase Pus10 [Candidatus Brocadiia bacterium]